MMKRRLMTPGPAPVPEETLLELAAPVWHHRTPEARELLGRALEGLKYVFQTAGDVVILTNSGTGAMEAAVANTLAPGEKALVLEAGRFAQRWGKLCEAHGAKVEWLSVPWGEAIEPLAVRAKLREHPDVRAVFATLSETSTGVGHDIEGIARVVAEADTSAGAVLLAVDGISGVGAMECRTDAWGIDLLAVGSQKALMLPPGLAFLSVSEKAWRKIETVKPRAHYFDLKLYRAKLGVPDTPFTPAHTLIRALVKSLDRIREIGLERMWANTELLGRACRAGIEAIGLELFARRPAAGVTAVRMPEGIDGAELANRLERRFGVKVAGGQDKLKGKIVRIAHMGYIDALDVISTLAALEIVLSELGHPVELGRSVAAVQRVLAGAD